ncbi:NAD(P)-binding domain-containing protein, partial [Enterococcus faecium]|nr:NAD(P)-binding domain-containing protein [Enterococcus faecium]
MKIGLIGLGKMGLNLAENMLDNNIEVLAFDVFDKARENAEKHNIITVDSIEQLVKQLDQPRIIWIMVPAGAPTTDTIGQLSNLLSKNDVVIDGGNT